MADAHPNAIPRHRLPVAWFDTLSTGTGSAEITQYLWKTERSRRLLLISTLLDTAEEDPDRLLGPLPAAGSVRGILTAAQAAAPEAFDDLMLYPQVGSWAAYALRRHRGGASSDLPLWVDFGGIHALGLAAAARAGLTWSTTVPVRDGCVMLPAAGMARLSADVTTVEASTTGGVIRLIDGECEVVIEPWRQMDTDEWWCLRRVRVGDGPTLTVWLDDLDPFRDLADPVPPARLDGQAFARWCALLEDAWSLLCRDHPDEAAAMADGVVSLVPLAPVPGWDTRSASNGEAFGSVMVSEPPDALTLAVALVHEYQHIGLGGLMHLLRLAGEDDGSLYYAPWRDDPRPLHGLLQGVYAFFGIANFWRRHRRTVSGPLAALADLEFAYARTQTIEAARIVRGAAALTDQGGRFVDGLLARLLTWSDETVPAEVTRLAGINADSHRAGWRLRHLHIDERQVAALATAWTAGGTPPSAGPARIVPHPDIRWHQRIPALTRLRAQGKRLPETTDPQGWHVLSAAENALVAGDLAASEAAYNKAVASAEPGPDDELRAWVGLALAGGAGRHAGTARALRERPELVRAVHARIGGGTDPLDIAAWLAPALGPPG
ncbi:HEXXH motif domain-containing protein [Phytohabitans rumicis]|uniref:HEXXH motif domain-containing protein n=1 Tax=Phytohabitans rumicis TaxID=1076125 RepID=UPI0015642CFC|nr:HEXXH motif domain-containing protein [Phytohabitans rumicis]